MIVCLGLTSLWNIWRYIAMVPICSSGTLTMCCHTGMPCPRHRTWHPTPWQKTDKGLTYHYANHWCGTSHWNTQLSILMSWVRPDREILPNLPNTPAKAQLWCCYGGRKSEARLKVYHATESSTRDLCCANPLCCPLAHSRFFE